MFSTQTFSLIIGKQDAKGYRKPIESASVPIRWCVSPDIVAGLQAKGAKTLFVLIESWCPMRHIRHRELYPLTQIETFFPVYAPGENGIRAAIVWSDRDLTHDLKKEFLTEQNSGYVTDVFDIDTDQPYPHKTISFNSAKSKCGIYEIGAYEEIDVPKGVFGKEPHAITKWIANIWTDNKHKDQCGFRRHLIFGLLFKMWFFGIYAIIRSAFYFLVMGLVALTFGKLMKMDSAKLPLSDWDKVEYYDNWFFNPKHKKRIVLFPYATLVPTFILWRLMEGPWVEVILKAIGYSFSAVCIVGLFLILMAKWSDSLESDGFSDAFWVWWDDMLHAWASRKNYDLMDEETALLLCPVASLQNKPTPIPFRRRSIRLWFQTAKNAVCKPMVGAK